MKAIETAYRGYRFRSRLEARWAVFFDALGLKWEYEKEGFHLPGGEMYLPDFYLPESKSWIEIKGGPATDKEIDKCVDFLKGKIIASEATDLIALADAKVTWGILDSIKELAGTEPSKDKVSEIASDLIACVRNREKVYLFEGFADNGWFMTTDGAVQVAPMRAIWFLANKKTSDLHSAFFKARGARFEHGETPRVFA